MPLKKFICQRESFRLILFNVLMSFGMIQGVDDCRMLEFKPSIVGSSLFDHVIKTHLTVSQDVCELKCYREEECMSINFGPGDSRAYLCELSNSDHELHPEDLKQRDGFIYRPTESACISNPCQSNGRCQTGFTDKGYRCVCSAGFTGEDCSKEIPLGHFAVRSGHSCKHISESGSSAGDGEYWIDPEHSGDPLKVYCDMTTDGGGWLLVANFVINSPNDPLDWTAETSYRGISNVYHHNRTGIKKSAMEELRAHLSFTQMRFHCSKNQGHTFHVTTVANSVGEAVVQYFSGQTDEMPDSCHSFEKMEDDDSRLAVQCDRWGYGDTHYVGKWGHSQKPAQHRMYNHAAFIANENHWHIVNGKWLCDDGSNLLAISPGDFWKIYVR